MQGITDGRAGKLRRVESFAPPACCLLRVGMPRIADVEESGEKTNLQAEKKPRDRLKNE